MCTVGNEASDDAVVVSPEWDMAADAPLPANAPHQNSAFPRIAAALMLAILAALIIATRAPSTDGAAPSTRSPTSSVASSPAETTSTLPSAPGTRAFVQFDGQVLGVDVGASLVSTDFDGRLFALDLDSGILTRSRVRTGNYVTISGRLAVQNGCGGWQIVDVPSFATSQELIGCDSYQPLGQLGAETMFFARPDSDSAENVLVDDGNGGLATVRLATHPPSSIATYFGGRVLINRNDAELMWVDPATDEVERYADGKLLAASPGGVLWSDSCGSDGRCRVWFGTPDDARLHQFVVEPFNLDQPVRITADGSRAVFFKPNDVLRIVTTETGHARELPNPGLSPDTATWSPDGLWLLQTSGADIIALNTLNGRVVEFEGIPGDFSPGWIALPETG